MTNGKSLAQMNQRTIFALIAFLVWIVSFHSTCCNAFVFGIQASQRSPKMPSKTALFLNNGSALQPQVSCSFQMTALRILSSFTSQWLQHLLDNRQTTIATPLWMTSQLQQLQQTASTGQQADNARHSTLNDVTTPTNKASTGLQADNDHHSILNGVTSP